MKKRMRNLEGPNVLLTERQLRIKACSRHYQQQRLVHKDVLGLERSWDQQRHFSLEATDAVSASLIASCIGCDTSPPPSAKRRDLTGAGLG